MNEVKPEINMAEIRKVLSHIEENVNRLEMAYFAAQRNELEKPDGMEWPECGTKACFAGWQVLLSSSPEEWKRICSANDIHFVELAQKGFGFTYDEARDVFSGWGSLEPANQLRDLKTAINIVLSLRGMEERV